MRRSSPGFAHAGRRKDASGPESYPQKMLITRPSLPSSNEAPVALVNDRGVSLGHDLPNPEQISTTLRAPRITAAGVSSVLPSA